MTSHNIGPRGGRYTDNDDADLQIEQVGGEFFLDRWIGDGWKNISVHRTYEHALAARAAVRRILDEIYTAPPQRLHEINAQLLEALTDMCSEFRALDLPYGSKAYAKAIDAIAAAKEQT